MSVSPFSPTSYYRFSNAAYPYTGISTGYKYENTPPHLGLTPYGSRSSENWQIYRQRDASGRSVYLIRNYDYGAVLQLGLTEQMRAVPQLLPKSGELGQQWMIERGNDGNWVLSNALLGNGSYLGVSEGGNSGLYTREVPAMQPSRDGSEMWTVTINVSAGKIIAEDALTDIELIQIKAPPPSTVTSLPFSTPPPSTGTSLTFYTPTSTPTDYPAIESSSGAAFVQVAFGFFGALFFIIAMLAYCNWTEKREYTLLRVEESEEEKEELPVYEEIERIESKEGKST